MPLRARRSPGRRRGLTTAAPGGKLRYYRLQPLQRSPGVNWPENADPGHRSIVPPQTRGGPKPGTPLQHGVSSQFSDGPALLQVSRSFESLQLAILKQLQPVGTAQAAV